MKEIIFQKKKENHFYAKRAENGLLEEVAEPVVGETYYEIPVVAGGAGDIVLLEIPVTLCETHLSQHPTDFVVDCCSGWKYLAIPVRQGSWMCYKCTNSLFMPIANLAYTNLINANLEHANLENANLARASLVDANLKDAHLASANLTYANLEHANLMNANLMNANLMNANLRDANLKYANLIYVNLEYANLTYANLINANLAYTNLINANLEHANLENANLKNAIYNAQTKGLTSRQKRVMKLV